MALDQAVLEILIRYGVDAASLSSVDAASKKLTQSFDQQRVALHAMRMEARELGQVGSTLALIGASISGPIAASAALYLKNTKEINATTIAWKAATDSVAASQERIGQVAAKAVLPLIQEAARLAGQVADFAEKNPDVVKAIFNVGSIVLAIGSFVKIASEGIRFVADVKLLFLGSQQQSASVLMNTAADKQLSAAATMAGSSGINQFGGVGTAQYGPAVASGVGSATTLGGIVSAVAPMLAVAAAALAVGKAFEMLNTEIIQPTQDLTKTMQQHADQVKLNSTSYADYQAEVKRINDLVPSYLKPFDAATMRAGDTIKAVTEEEYNLAKAEAGQAEAAQNAATAAAKLTDNMILLGRDLVTAADRAAHARSVFAGMGTIGAGTQAGSDYLNTQRGALAATNPAVMAYADYQKKIAELEKQYGDQRATIIQDTLKQASASATQWNTEMKKAVGDFFKQSARAAQDFARQQSNAALNFANQEQLQERDYYQNRLKEAAQFGLDMQRLEENHQLEMSRLSEDHTKSLRKLADSRDALGVEDEIDRYNTERSRKEQDYGIEVSRRNQDYGLMLKQQEQAFAQQRADALEAFKKQQQDARDNFAQQQQQKKEDFAQQQIDQQQQHIAEVRKMAQDSQDKLTTLDNQHILEKIQQWNNFVDSERNLGIFIGTSQSQWDNYYAYIQSGLNKLISGLPPQLINSPTPNTGFVPQHAAGGYTSQGLAYLHSGEYVLSANATRRAEQIVGGRLSQNNIVNGGATVNASFNINGAGDPSAVASEVKRALISVARGLQQRQQGVSL